jgi:hypothetical protein
LLASLILVGVVLVLDKGVTMVVELLEDKKRWDQFVETSPQGSLFHKWDFLKTVERHSKYRFLPYCVYSGEELRCIFPFFTGRSRSLRGGLSINEHRLEKSSPIFSETILVTHL